MAFLVTCEHGSSHIPQWLANRFAPVVHQNDAADPSSEIKCDFGAEAAAKLIARHLRCPMIAGQVSPSVVDLNRASLRGMFSIVSRQFPAKLRARIKEELHVPYRLQVESAIEKLMRKEDLVIHLSVHSFATFDPNAVTKDVRKRVHNARRTDLGLLYDPARIYELSLCLDWYDELYHALPMLRVRRNYPRRGTADSLIRALRLKYPADCYIGVELQLNRAWCVRDVPVRRKVFNGIAKSLLRVCDASQREAA